MAIYYFFAFILILLGIKSLKNGFDFRQYLRSEVKKGKSNFTPKVSLIAPFCGLDPVLTENVKSLFGQSFPNYEIIFVLESESDLATEIILKTISEHNPNEIETTICFAGKAFDSGQKVHNLLAAIEKTSPETEIFAFVDSDARPSEDWLRNLVEPLANENVGVATGYRWFVPDQGGFWTHFRSVWNASIASQLGSNAESNFCWGGSMAIRKNTFFDLKMADRWKGTVSDDFVLTEACREANLKIYFAAKCLTESIGDCKFGEMLEFTTRQMIITRVYSNHLWKASLIGSGLFSMIFWFGIGSTVFTRGFDFWILIALLSFIFLLGSVKSVLRFNAVEVVLRRRSHWAEQLSHSILWVFTPILFFYNSVAAGTSRRINWRGTSYELISETELKIINPKK
jgi:ceramide glucosyltransferase